MYFLLKFNFIIYMEIISLVSACLALFGAIYRRKQAAPTVWRKGMEALVPFFMATSIWIIHYIILFRAMALTHDKIGFFYPFISYLFVVFGFYCALKVIDLGFSFSNYISGGIIGTFIATDHVVDKYVLSHHGAGQGVGLSLSADAVFLVLSFVVLWSSIVGYLMDYFKNHEMISYLKTIAYTDSLTGLGNRNALNDRFGEMLLKSAQEQSRFACMIIDLNKFKDINDTYGHLMGDEVLAMIGAKLKEAFKTTHYFVGRLGGDEFIVLAGYHHLADIEAVAKTIYRIVLEPNRVEDALLRVGCCIGIALFPDDGATQKILMSHADLSLYEMKKNRRDGICFYNKGLMHNIVDRSVLLPA